MKQKHLPYSPFRHKLIKVLLAVVLIPLLLLSVSLILLSNQPLYVQVIASLVSLLLGVGLAIFVAQRLATEITTPILNMVESVDIIAQGDFFHRADFRPDYELALLQQSLNAMVYSLASYIETIEEAEEEMLQRNRDLTNLIQVSQTIAREIKLDRLLSRLIRVVLETAEAERCVLISERDGLWVIEAEGAIDQIEVTVLQSVPVGVLHTSSLVPGSIINHVVRNQVPIIVNHVALDGQFRRDAYIKATKPRSLFCIPFFDRGQLTGMFYLENGVFSSDRVQILELLASQAAVSIANARLFMHQLQLTEAYSRFVPREFLRFLKKDSILQVSLGDQTQQEMTVLFADIRAFTSLSENMSPEENFRFINAYFGRMSPIIREYNGFIDKYIGDGIMALFPERADDALKAAIAMQKSVVAYNTTRTVKKRQPISIGIGLHTGNVMLGTVGEEARMEGTVISDGVNLSSRLEDLTKLYGVSILVSDRTLFNLENPTQYHFRFLDKVRVKGKQEPVAVFEMLDGETEEAINLKMQTRTDFEKGLLHYYSREFEKARQYFEAVLQIYEKDRAAQLYFNRVTHFITHGVPDDWEGVETLTEK